MPRRTKIVATLGPATDEAYTLDRLIAAGKVAYRRVEGERLDTGEPAGYLDAVLRSAAADPSLRPVLERFARETLGLK